MKLLLINIMSFISFLLFSEIEIDKAINSWNRNSLLSLSTEIQKKNNKEYEDYFNLTKIYYYLSVIDFADNQFKFSEDSIREDNNNKGFLYLSNENGEKAYELNNSDPELIYYLTKNYLSLIDNPQKYLKYFTKQEMYRKINLKNYKNNFYTNIYEMYFLMSYPANLGGDKNKAKSIMDNLEKEYQDKAFLFDIIAELYYFLNDFEKVIIYSKKTLEIDKEYYPSKKRINFIDLISSNPIIKDINIINKEKTYMHFIKVKIGDILNFDNLKRIKSDLCKYKAVEDVNIMLIGAENNEIIINLDIKTSNNKILYFSSGYELKIIPAKINNYEIYLSGINPPVFSYNQSDIFKNGMFDFSFITAMGLMYDAKLNCNVLEYFDWQIEFDMWPIPLFNSITEYSYKKEFKSSLMNIYFKPSIGLGKIFKNPKISIMFFYEPDFIFFLPETYPLNNFTDKENFIMPGSLIIEHNINISFILDYITLFESGWVRKGFYLKLSADWYKHTPDETWGYENDLNIPKNNSFIFNFRLEYSDFIKDIFYFSLNFQYKGGINYYKNNLIPIGKDIIGIPFGYMIGIHGFPEASFLAEHVFLFNSQFGFKVNKTFHFGFLIDICNFFEKDAMTYIVRLQNSNLYANQLSGFGVFFKIACGNMLDLLFEGSFGYEAGSQKIYGPIFGIFMQKIIINPNLKKKEGLDEADE